MGARPILRIRPQAIRSKPCRSHFQTSGEQIRGKEALPTNYAQVSNPIDMP